MPKRIELDPARCPQCQQVLSASDFAEDCGEDFALQCETRSCLKADDDGTTWLFKVEDHYEHARSEDSCDFISEEPVRIGVVEDGIVYLDDATDAFRRAFPELCS